MAKTVEEYLKLMIGQLVITNADLAARVSALQEQAEALQAQAKACIDPTGLPTTETPPTVGGGEHPPASVTTPPPGCGAKRARNPSTVRPVSAAGHVSPPMGWPNGSTIAGGPVHDRDVYHSTEDLGAVQKDR